MRRILSLLAALLSVPLAAGGAEITRIFPEVAYPGTPVSVIGGPFSPEAQIDLGGTEVNARPSGDRQLDFITPQLPVGEYALYVRDGGETSSATFSLRIELPPPRIEALEPNAIDVCTNVEPMPVRLRGEHIQPGAQLLLDGAVIPYQQGDDLTLGFEPPTLASGSYGLQVVNPDGKRSLPYTLWVNSQPEIESVSAGEDFVNYYQILIRGKNFFQRSVLVLAEYSSSFGDLPPRQQIIPAQGAESPHGVRSRTRHADTVTYRDCHTLVYNRYAPTGQEKRLVLRISNPNGQQTAAYEVNLP